MSSHDLSLSNLSVGISNCHIVKEVSLHLDKGQSLIVMGPNGSGKSTLLKAMSGIEENLLEVNYDHFTYQNSDLTALDYKSRSTKWTIVPQFPEWQRGLYVSEYLEFSRFPYFGDGRGFDDHLLQSISNGLALQGLLSKKLEHLSGGERKRVAIAAALYQDVPLVYLDEPFQALDPLAKLELANFLRQWQKERQLSYVISSHDFYWSYQLCDIALFLKKGEPLFLGARDDIFTSEKLESLYNVPFRWVELEEGDGFFTPLKKRATHE